MSSAFQRKVDAVDIAARQMADRLGLDSARKSAAAVAAQAVATPGVLVRVVCDSASQFDEQIGLLSFSLSNYLRDLDQYNKWDDACADRLAKASNDEFRGLMTKILREGITFELKNGSGVEVRTDDGVVL